MGEPESCPAILAVTIVSEGGKISIDVTHARLIFNTRLKNRFKRLKPEIVGAELEQTPAFSFGFGLH